MRALILLLLICSPVFSSDLEPVVYRGSASIDDPSLKGMSWHRWTTRNFTINSINLDQGIFLSGNIEAIKSWIFKRWGIKNYDFSTERRAFCVYDKTLMAKLFNGLDLPKTEIRGKSGRMEVVGIWMLLDDSPVKTIPVQITEACFADLEYNYNIPYCLIRGMACLNSPVTVVRQELKELGVYVSNNALYFPHTMFKITRSQYASMKSEDRKLFDRECMVLLLLFRKEFGEEKLHLLLQNAGKNPEAALTKIYNFSNMKRVDAIFFTYTKVLMADILSNKTPNSYLEIKGK
jgi:hypothetical protein